MALDEWEAVCVGLVSCGRKAKAASVHAGDDAAQAEEAWPQRSDCMILTRMREAPSRELSTFAWAGLQRYLNEEYVTDSISTLHGVEKKQRPNAQKQARQIRYCLMQAREYAAAAERVSLVTKPTLYYYCVMCLALAEILLKQSGESSLDRAREQHRHHGLDFKIDATPNSRSSLGAASNALRAAPAIRGGARFGTFELWHQSCREMPITGLVTQTQGIAATTYQHNVVLGAGDRPLEPLPSEGISLLSALVHLPSMAEHVDAHGHVPQIVRASVSAQGDGGQMKSISVMIHPGNEALVSSFLDNCSFHADAVDRVDFVHISTGGHLSWSTPSAAHAVPMSIAHGSMFNTGEARFWPSNRPLNEFGYFYLALFIAGNYARYYPDRWIVDVEKSSPLALAIEELLRCAVERVPLLALSELSRFYYVPK